MRRRMAAHAGRADCITHFRPHQCALVHHHGQTGVDVWTCPGAHAGTAAWPDSSASRQAIASSQLSGRFFQIDEPTSAYYSAAGTTATWRDVYPVDRHNRCDLWLFMAITACLAMTNFQQTTPHQKSDPMPTIHFTMTEYHSSMPYKDLLQPITNPGLAGYR